MDTATTAAVEKVKHQRAKEDEELGAIKKIGFILDQLPYQAAQRVLLYVHSRQADRNRPLVAGGALGGMPPPPSDSDALRASF